MSKLIPVQHYNSQKCFEDFTSPVHDSIAYENDEKENATVSAATSIFQQTLTMLRLLREQQCNVTINFQPSTNEIVKFDCDKNYARNSDNGTRFFQESPNYDGYDDYDLSRFIRETSTSDHVSPCSDIPVLNSNLLESRENKLLQPDSETNCGQEMDTATEDTAEEYTEISPNMLPTPLDVRRYCQKRFNKSPCLRVLLLKKIIRKSFKTKKQPTCRQRLWIKKPKVIRIKD